MRKVPVFTMSEVPDEVGFTHFPTNTQTIELRLDRAQQFLDNLFPDGPVKLTVVEAQKRYRLSRD